MENSESYKQMIDGDVVKVDLTEPPKDKRKKESFWPRIAYSVVSLLAGIVFIAARSNIYAMLGYIVGIVFLVVSAVTITAFVLEKRKKWVGSLIWGVLQAIIGIYCLFNPKWLADAAIYIFATIIFISGVVLIYYAIKDKANGFINWKPVLIFGIVLAVLGLVMLFFVNQTQAVLAVITGIVFIITSALNVVALALK